MVPETAAYDAMLPPDVIDPMRTWLHGARRGRRRARPPSCGTPSTARVRSLAARVFVLAAAADAQAEAAVAPASGGRHGVRRCAWSSSTWPAADGSLLRGEVLARWQEFVGTGELMRALESKVSRLRDRVTAAVKGKPQPGEDLAEALESGVEALVRVGGGHGGRAGRHGLGRRPGRRRSCSAATTCAAARPGSATRPRSAVRDWQAGVLELVRSQGQGKRSTARYLAFGVNALGLMVMIVVFAHTGGLVGGEVAVAGGAAALSQKILEAVLGDQAVRVAGGDGPA